MTSKLKVFLLISFAFAFAWSSCGPDQGFCVVVKQIFLTKPFNSTESEEILKLARESFLYLKDVEKEADVNEKLNFVKNYANFLLKLFNEFQTKDVDIYELFSKENSFLKDYDHNQMGADVNVTVLKTKIEDLQFAAERYLNAHFNSTGECYEPFEMLALNQTKFDAFLKEKLRAEFSEIGYFFLEVFATLIGLSWGVISTVLYYAEQTSANPATFSP